MDRRTEVVLEALYRALARWDHEVRQARNLRMAMGRGRGPRTVRGTRRSAQARFLTAAVLTALREEETSD